MVALFARTVPVMLSAKTIRLLAGLFLRRARVEGRHATSEAVETVRRMLSRAKPHSFLTPLALALERHVQSGHLCGVRANCTILHFVEGVEHR